MKAESKRTGSDRCQQQRAAMAVRLICKWHGSKERRSYGCHGAECMGSLCGSLLPTHMHQCQTLTSWYCRWELS